MSKLSLLLFATTLAFGASTVVLYQKLQAEREQNRLSRQGVARLEPATAAAIQTASIAQDHPQTADLDRPPPPPPPPTQKVRSSDSSRNDEWASDEIKLLKDPRYRASAIARYKLGIDRRNPDLARVLGLSGEDLDRFLDLLARQQLQEHERVLAAMQARELSKEEETVDTRRQRKEIITAQLEAEQRSLLGDERLQAWNDYVNTRPTREAVSQLRVKLVDAGVPLRSDQVEPLVADLTAERRRHEADREALYSSQRSNYNATPPETIEYMNKRLALIEDHLDRAHDVAAAHLTSNQLDLFDEMLEQQRRQARVETTQYNTSAKLQSGR